ncbi:pheophytinase chloroplastic [Phtheirospermum japonicum]|uniref:Pheophytinase chloroplastic n=1 Tax=Phtheirospermum japonicum TaxID=374723 RepID=A0A830C0X8_9LAMI|nr:pheophytinase chloroplastic [Phtheirospermum japonicum]
MASCSCSTLYFSSPWPDRITHNNSPSFLSIRSRKISKEFSIPRTNSGINFSRRNVFSVLSSLVDNFSVDDADFSESAAQDETKTSTWKWRGYSIRYQYSGSSGPALVLVHGFGANSDHWRKNLPVLAQSHRVYAIDLIGYGYSDKPNPQNLQVKNFYTFETWASQLNDFCVEIVKGKAFFVCNSIGVMNPAICKGIIVLNISLRMLHIKKQPWNTALGKFFFKVVATPESVRNILCQCYYDTSQVTDELVKIILEPGLDPGAADVFLEFICYSGGPLPEELLPQVKCPVLVAWGDKDPWEPIDLGRAYAKFDSVEDFVVLPNVGHCPQDEAPQLVNPLVTYFVARHGSIAS